MGSVVDRLVITPEEAALFFRVNIGDDDALIQDLVNAAKERADEYMGNAFEEVYRERVGRGDGSTVAFTLHTKPVLKMRKLYIDNAEHSVTSGVSTDKTTGVVTFEEAPDDGVLIEATYDAECKIPTTVRNWVLTMALRAYENRANGQASSSDPLGSVSWKEEDYRPLWEYRVNPGF